MRSVFFGIVLNVLCVGIGGGVLNSRPVQAATEVYTFVVEKQEKKVKSRWSLEDWLSTRDRIRMMDLWLALHSPTPYEFYFGGDYQIGNDSTQGAFTAGHWNFAAFASIFGLEFDRQTGPNNQISGLAKVRIFGFHQQGTNIVLGGGARQRQLTNAFIHPIAFASITLYLKKYFGLEGSFTRAFPAGTPDYDAFGNRFLAGAFIDFSALRVYGNYFTEVENIRTTTGFAGGLRLFL